MGGTLALLLSGLFIQVLAPLGWMDRPDQGRKQHARPTPLTGGVALWAVLVLGSWAGWLPFAFNPVERVGINLMALIGLVDDRFHLGPRFKAMTGLLIGAMLAIHVAQLAPEQVSDVRFLGATIPLRFWVIVPILTLWFWALPQAYNLIDGINGMSMGFALLGLAALELAAPHGSELLLGALVALLLLNYPRAWHFLGDSGALMLGTLFAILSVRAFAHSNPDLLLWMFAYPSVDVALVVATRLKRRSRLGSPDRSHLHHWMVRRLGPRRSPLAAPLLLGLAGLPMLRTLPIPWAQPLSFLGLLTLVGLAVHVFLQQTRTSPAGEWTASSAPSAARTALVGSLVQPTEASRG